MTSDRLSALGALLLAASCGGTQSGMLEGTDGTAVVVEAPADGALEYRTEPSPEPVVGDAAEAVARGVARGAEDSQTTLTGDGRLALLAAWTAEHLGEGGTPPPHEVMEFFAHHLGIVEPTPHLVILGQPDATMLEAGIADSISQRLSRQPYTHYGAAAFPRQGLTLAVVTLSGRFVELAPFARQVAVGAPLRIEGRLLGAHRDPSLAITLPDGDVVRVSGGEGPLFAMDVPTDRNGVHRIELLARGPRGDTVLANMPVYVGVDAPRSVSLAQPGGDGSSSPERVADALLALLNDARASVGARSLEAHTGMAEVARAHSRDMIEHSFVGHESPRTGSAADRVRRSGVQTNLVLENIGRGYGAIEIHRGLMASPGHRANVVNPDVTHVGIGVVAEQEGDRQAYVATQVFIRQSSVIDLDDAPERLLAMINDVRDRRGARPLQLDTNLTNAASEGARRFFEEQGLSQQDTVDDASASLRRFAIAFSRVGGLMAVVDQIEEAGRLEPTFDPDVRYIGIGLAQGTRPDVPANSIAVVIMLGWPR